MTEAKEKHPDYLVLVNEENRIPAGFEDTIERIWVGNVAGTQFEIEKKTYEAFCQLQEDVLKNYGIQIDLLGSYRTVQYQEDLFAQNLAKYGFEHTNRYVAKPGCSEHHTGFAIDVGILLDGKFYHKREDLLSVDRLFKIIQKKLPKYGFILRYPEGKEAITKIAYEPWHYRYIDSPELAQKMTEQGICLEEYWQNK